MSASRPEMRDPSSRGGVLGGGSRLWWMQLVALWLVMTLSVFTVHASPMEGIDESDLRDMTDEDFQAMGMGADAEGMFPPVGGPDGDDDEDFPFPDDDEDPSGEGDEDKEAAAAKELEAYTKASVTLLSGKAEYTEFIEKNNPSLITFVQGTRRSRWQNVANSYRTTSQRLSDEESDLRFGLVDVSTDTNAKWTSKMKLEKFPAHFYVVDKKRKPLTNMLKTPSHFYTYLTTFRPIVVGSDSDQKERLTSFLTGHSNAGNVVLVAHVRPNSQKEFLVQQIAERTTNIENRVLQGSETEAHNWCTVVVRHVKDGKPMQLEIYSSLDSVEVTKDVYNGKWSLNAVAEALTAHRLPVVSARVVPALHMPPHTELPVVVAIPRPMIGSVDTLVGEAMEGDEGKIDDMLKLLAKTAKLEKERLLFAVLSPKHTHPETKDFILSNFGARAIAEPCLLLFEANPSQQPTAVKYRTTKISTEDDVKTFIKEYHEGKLKRFRKSQDLTGLSEKGSDDDKDDEEEEVYQISEADKEYAVEDMNADTFDAMLQDPSRSAFVEFYAPWCGHCKSLKPKWEELAVKIHRRQQGVTIARFDCTANDVPDAVMGFPTLIWYPKGSNKMRFREIFNGARDSADMEEYIEEMLYTDEEAEVVEKEKEEEEEEEDDEAEAAPKKEEEKDEDEQKDEL